MSALLEIEDLRGDVSAAAPRRCAAPRSGSRRGETHCLVGESGCGKSVTALAIMSLLARGGQRSREAPDASPALICCRCRIARWRGIRGNRMAMIFQEPMTSLNPAFTVGSQMAEVLTRHKGVTRAAALDRAVELHGPRRHHRAGHAARPVSAPALGRPAPARHDRDGADVRSRTADRRRADHGARRHGAGADPAAARRRSSASSASSILLITHDLGDRRARRRPRVGDVCGRGGRTRADRGTVPRAAASLHARAALLRAGAGQGAARQAARLDPGRGADDPPGFAGCAFRSRCSHADATCARAIPRRQAGAAHDYLCRLAPQARGAATRMNAAIEVANCGASSACASGMCRRTKRVIAVDDVSFSVPRRQRARHRRRVRLRQIDARAPDPRSARADIRRPRWSTASGCSISTARRAPG